MKSKGLIFILVFVLGLVLLALIWIYNGETISTPLGDLVPPTVDLDKRDEASGIRGNIEEFQEQGY